MEKPVSFKKVLLNSVQQLNFSRMAGIILYSDHFKVLLLGGSIKARHTTLMTFQNLNGKTSKQITLYSNQVILELIWLSVELG